VRDQPRFPRRRGVRGPSARVLLLRSLGLSLLALGLTVAPPLPAIADWSCELGAKPSSVNRRQAVPLEKLIADTTPEREPEAGRSCEPLPVPAGSPAWTQAEQWAWQRICRSRVANMWQYAGPLHGEPPIDAPPDPRAPDRPPPPRPADLDDWNRWVTGNQALAGALTLGNTFLRQVLTQTAVGNYAVVALRNAYLESPDLRWVHSQRLLDIQHSYLAGEATFASAALGGLVINNSRVQRNLELSGIQVGSVLAIRGSGIGRFTRAVSARADGSVTLEGSLFRGGLSLNSMRARGGLSLEGAGVGAHGAGKALNLVGAHVGGQLQLAGVRVMGDADLGQVEVHLDALLSRSVAPSCFRGRLLANDARFDSGLVLDDALVMGAIMLASSTVATDLSIRRTKLTRALELQGLDVNGSISLERLEPIWQYAPPKVRGEGLRAGSLRVRDVRAALLDLRGAEIRGDWHPSPPATTANAELSASACPEAGSEVDAALLQGLRYARLRGAAETPDPRQALAASACTVLAWLEDAPFSPGPYATLARVLQHTGERGMADAVRFAGRRHERRQERSAVRSAGLLALETFIGYGYGDGYLRALLSAVIMVLLGWAVHWWVVPSRPRVRAHMRLLYSIDALIPLVRLYPYSDDRRAGLTPSMSRLGVWYFAFHRLIGALLVAVIVAALSGLTQGLE